MDTESSNSQHAINKPSSPSKNKRKLFVYDGVTGMPTTKRRIENREDLEELVLLEGMIGFHEERGSYQFSSKKSLKDFYRVWVSDKKDRVDVYENVTELKKKMNDLESRFNEEKSNVVGEGGSVNRQLVDTSISRLSNLIWGSKDNNNGGPADIPKDFIPEEDLVLLFVIRRSNNSSTEGDLYEKWLKLNPRYGSKGKFDRKIQALKTRYLENLDRKITANTTDNDMQVFVDSDAVWGNLFHYMEDYEVVLGTPQVQQVKGIQSSHRKNPPPHHA